MRTLLMLGLLTGCGMELVKQERVVEDALVEIVRDEFDDLPSK